ncbi:Outer membrane efflux protein [Phycisphaerae bacterium RAS1]|nr:Outer membrane efflux protein [Phycisphaerae bacterium RAS1]
MNRNAASGTIVAIAWLGMLLSGCAQIDHRTELQEAAQRFEKLTGRNPSWREPFEGGELVVDGSGVLTLDNSLQLGLQNNRSLRADLEVIGQAKADLIQAGLLPNPMLAVSLQFPEAGGLAKLTFGLAQDLAAIWLIPRRVEAARDLLQQRILSVADTALGLTTDIRANYSALQYQTLAIRFQEQNLQILREAMEIAQARLRAGSTSQLDVNLVQSRYLETDLELLALRSEFAVTQRTLLRLLGVARAMDQWRPTEMSLDPPRPALMLTEAQLVEVALLQRLDLQAADFERDAALADFEQQRLRVIQSLGIAVMGERFERRALPGRNLLADTARASVAARQLTAPEIESAGQRRIERSQEIESVVGPALEVSLPIFDQNQAQIAKAQFRARELHERYREVEQRIVESVRSALTQRRLAQDRVRVFRQSLLPLQESNLDLSETAYRAGRESILTVLLAQESLIRTRLGHAAALRDLEISTANLERQLAGRLSELETHPPTTQPASQPTGERDGPSISAASGASGADGYDSETEGVPGYDLAAKP